MAGPGPSGLLLSGTVWGGSTLGSVPQAPFPALAERAVPPGLSSVHQPCVLLDETVGAWPRRLQARQWVVVKGGACQAAKPLIGLHSQIWVLRQSPAPRFSLISK